MILLFLLFRYLFLTGLGAGYPCFVISIAMIGVCTAVIGDVAGHLGCFIYLKDSVNAIAFVALGTSVPGINFQLLANLKIDQFYRDTGCTLTSVERVYFLFFY